MSNLERVYYFLEIIANFLLIGGFIWFVTSIFRTWDYERKINKLYDGLDKEIEEIKKRGGVGMSLQNARIQNLKEKYKPKIEELKRKRQFILDKLPFIK